MPTLKCSATTCIYNKEELCSKGDILVTGDTANVPDQTSCGSFQERRGDSMTNSCADGCESIYVDCEATRCVYNDNRKCVASQIGIAGSDAKSSQQTMCGTFRSE